MKNKKNMLKRLMNMLAENKEAKPENSQLHTYEPSSCQTYERYEHNYRLNSESSRMTNSEVPVAYNGMPSVQLC